MSKDPVEQAKTIGDFVAAGLTGAALMEWITPAAALLSLLYALIRVYETQTVQRMIARWRKTPPPTSSN